MWHYIGDDGDQVRTNDNNIIIIIDVSVRIYGSDIVRILYYSRFNNI